MIKHVLFEHSYHAAPDAYVIIRTILLVDRIQNIKTYYEYRFIFRDATIDFNRAGLGIVKWIQNVYVCKSKECYC